MNPKDASALAMGCCSSMPAVECYGPPIAVCCLEQDIRKHMHNSTLSRPLSR